MNTPIQSATIRAQVSGSAPEPEIMNGKTAMLTSSEASRDTALMMQVEERSRMDPHGLRDGAPLAFALYAVAIECYPRLLNGTLDKATLLQRLRRRVPNSAFQIDYVARQALKFINPRGHGANSARFSHETLGWFRQAYPEDAHLTAGLSLLLCAAKWWASEQGHRSIQPRMNPLTTSHLDRKLKDFGFLSGERQAICRMLRRPSSHR